jgi:acetylornithine deacetylase
MRRPVADLLRDLVSIPSVSATSNWAVLDYVATFLDARQWSIQTFPYTDAAGTPKANLVALTRNASGPSAELAFVCHSDTVPFDPAWEYAVHPQLYNGRIYGRGSCDVKGFLACVLAAVEDLDLARLRKPLALIVTADEEVGCLGAKRLAAERPLSTRYLLIGEPTCMRPVRAGKGYALATITVRGREAHSAFPAAGRSAIFDAARVVSALERLAAELEEQQDPAFDPPFPTLNVGLIEGGTAKNIVPGECRLTIEWRPIPGANPNRVPRWISRELADLRRSFPGFCAELEVLRMDPPFAPSPAHRFEDLLTALTGHEATTIAFGSEAAHLQALAEEVIVMGPGDMTTAHRTGEFVPVGELVECVACLREAVERLCC